MSKAATATRPFHGLKKEVTRYRRQGADLLTMLETESRARLDTLEREVAELRALMRNRIEQALKQVCRTLHIPTQDDLATLAERLDALDQKLEKLEKNRGTPKKKAAPRSPRKKKPEAAE
jgi:hypothetical protein